MPYYRANSPKWTFIFLAVVVVVFILELSVDLDQFAFTPAYAFKTPWTFVTSIFMHASFGHLFFNMFALFVFGLYLETRIDEKLYLLIFFLSGIFGNVAYLITDPGSIIPAVGASGSIYGIIGTLAVLYPTLIVYVGFAPMPMLLTVFFWAILNIIGLFNPSSNIGYQAHLAGLLVGVLFGIYKRRQKKSQIFKYMGYSAWKIC